MKRVVAIAAALAVLGLAPVASAEETRKPGTVERVKEKAKETFIKVAREITRRLPKKKKPDKPPPTVGGIRG